jgi:hypothetical protein
MSEDSVKVLLLGESEAGWFYLARRLEQNGCHCWFVRSTEEAVKLLDGEGFRLILSTKPLHLANSVIARMGELNCSAYYCCPVENGCWWLPVVTHGKKCLGAPAMRPSEFVGALDQIVREAETTVAVSTSAS